jgi:hypothetical protein
MTSRETNASPQVNASGYDIENEKLHKDIIDNKCQFSNRMSSSQFQCHLDAIYDMKMRMNDLSTLFGSAGEEERAASGG